jgi:hypothetical protein
VKRVFILALGLCAAEALAQVCNNNSFTDAYLRGQQLELENRRLLLEERKVFLSSFEHSHISQESARDLSNRILDQLQDYPKGKKSGHRPQDVELLMETIATLQSGSLH